MGELFISEDFDPVTVFILDQKFIKESISPKIFL